MFENFGNKVKIKKSPETEALNFANKIGIIYGSTTPSVTGVSVIGNSKDDSAINVYFDDLNESFWFNEDLLEEIDNGEGITMTLDGVDKKWTKGSDGSWIEENIRNKKWWKFWKV